MNEFEEFYYKDATEHVYVYDHMPSDLDEIGEMLIEWDALPEISRVMNNSFYFYGTYRRDGQHAEMLEKGNILKAYCENDTWQYFKISKANPNLETVSVTARPIAFEANNNFIEYMFVSNGSGQSIMDKIQSSLAFAQKVKYNACNVSSLHQFTIKEAKPLEAIWGSNNGNINLANLVGGEVDFDNWTITLRDKIGEDSGYNIDFGVNLEAIESEIDDESVVNSLYLIGGTEENDYDEDKDPIKYKYLEVKGVNDSNRRIGKRENSECLTETDLKKWGQSLFDKDRIHEPKATHKISMVILEYTEEYYELYQTLGRLHFGDTAHVYNDKYDEYYEERMFEYVWYPTLKKYKSIVLGSAGQRYTASVQTETQKLQQKLENKTTMLVEAVRNATGWITGTKGGYVRFRPEKSPSEILIMDKPNVKDAKKVWRWNMGGLGFSSTGVDGEYGLAMTQDGAIVADFITTGVLRAIEIIGVTIKGSSFETINADGIHMTIEKGMIRFFNDGGKSLGSIDMTNSDKPTLNIYNKSGNGNIGMGPDVLKIQHQKEIEFVAPVFRTQRIDANEIYINGQKVYPGGSGGGVGPGGETYEPINIGSNITGNPNIVAWLEKYTKLYGISDYIGLAYALIMVENSSTDGTDDIMQSSESAGYPGPGYLTGEASVKQGCKHLAAQIKNGQDKGVDIWGVMQGYNFGSAYIPWLASRGGKNTTDLAETYSRTVVAPSLGNTTGATYPYINEVSKADGRTYLYTNGGNFHYAAMIRQYVKVNENTGWVIPISKPVTVTSEFGWRTSPINGSQELHNGIDLVNGNPTTPIYAADGGEVVIAGSYPEWYGNYVVIKHSGGLYTGYAHQSQLRVSIGQTVKKGQQIGNMGTTGPSTGNHLHFQFFKNGPWPATGDFINPREKMNF